MGDKWGVCVPFIFQPHPQLCFQFLCTCLKIDDKWILQYTWEITSSHLLGSFTFFNVWRRLRGWGTFSFLMPWTTGKPFSPIYMDRRWCHSTVKAFAVLALPSWLTTNSNFSDLGSLSKTQHIRSLGCLSPLPLETMDSPELMVQGTNFSTSLH